MSKFSLDVLQRCVYPFVQTEDEDVLLGSSFGEDIALTRVGGSILASHVDPIVGAMQNIGWLAVHVACNDIATSGVQPRWLQILVLVPSAKDEQLLEQIMRDASRAAGDLGASIIGGHSGYSAGISRPLVSVTALGVATDIDPVRSGEAQIGDQILVTKGIGLEGTAILAQDFADVARELGLSEDELAQASSLMGEVSVVPEATRLAQAGATAMHDVTRGGLMETLLEIAYLSGVQVQLTSNAIPTRPIVDRFAQAFQFDPLRMISSGSLAVAMPHDRVQEALEVMEAMDVPCAVVGEVLDGSGVRLIKDGKHQDFDRIQAEYDELARMWELYPRGD